MTEIKNQLNINYLTFQMNEDIYEDQQCPICNCDITKAIKSTIGVEHYICEKCNMLITVNNKK